jgi:hypothetical protein
VKVKILPTALEDLDRGRRFYARQRKSLGNYFLDALFSDIDSLELYAGIHIKVFDFHRLLAKRFPYAVYYQVNGETCFVFRVLDCRQEPEKATEGLR